MEELILASLETFPNFVVVNSDGRIAYLTDSYAKLLGTTKEAAAGKPVENVIPGTRLNTILKTGEEEIGSVMTLYDHSQNCDVSVVCNRIPIIKNGEIIGALAVTIMNNLSEVNKLHEEVDRIRRENTQYKEKLQIIEKNMHPLEQVIGLSDEIRNIKKMISDYADSNLAILITGETGVGKEVIAKAIHHVSRRAFNNYVKINCSAIPSELLESELFGYEEGAFTGAAKSGKVGKFELADKGTLLLDEIGDMPMNLQVKLLRAIQEKEFEKIGGLKTIPFTARLICCTNQNIDAMIANGTFRQDLYYRINAVEINILPLRERLCDIEPLCQHFISRINRENNLDIRGLDEKVLEMFYNYSWPGNVRELEQVVERASIICKGDVITTENLEFFADKVSRQKSVFVPNTTNNSEKRHNEDFSLHKQALKTEKELIIQALLQTGGNKTKAAKLLNIDRSRLYSKLKKHEIQ